MLGTRRKFSLCAGICVIGMLTDAGVATSRAENCEQTTRDDARKQILFSTYISVS